MNDVLFIFGLPGAGKSYVATILNTSFGYAIHNGDEDLPKIMKKALIAREDITDEMRSEFTNAMILHIQQLRRTHPKLAVHQTLIKEHMREALQKAFPDARFIFVVCDEQLRENRYQKREYFNLGLAYLRKMSAVFDQPSLQHVRINNSKQGPEALKKALNFLLSPLDIES